MSGLQSAHRRDALGTLHPEVIAAHTRIVSLVPSITELLFDLELGAHVVGRTSFCVHPGPAVAAVPRVGGTKTVRLDKLLALEPTHVIVNVDENTREVPAQIAAAGPSVIVTHPVEPTDNLRLYRLLGSIFGRVEPAEALCQAFDEGLQRLRARRDTVAQRRVLYLIWRDPWMTVSPDTYISRMFSEVGWLTACGSARARYPVVDFDQDALGDLDLVLLSSEPYPFKAKHCAEVAAALDGARTAQGGAGPAVRLIDGEMLSWYGSRAIKGLRYLEEFARESQPC